MVISNISNCLLNSSYSNSFSGYMTYLMPSNEFFSKSVHLHITFYGLILVRGCGKYDCLEHMYLLLCTNSMNTRTWNLFLMASYLIWIILSYLSSGFHSESPRILDITCQIIHLMTYRYYT